MKIEPIRDVRISANRALDYLAKRINTDGFWREFEPRHGNSTYWTTSYIGELLPTSARVVKPAVEAVTLGQHPNGGWSYNDIVPSDTDSTANSLLFLRKNDVNSEVVKRGLDYLLKHQHESGGFSTYNKEEYKQLNNPENGAGWCSPHNCVTSLVSQALIELGADENSITRGIDFLLNTQEEGLWKPYWWTSREYSTFHAVKALVNYGEHPKEVRRALTELASKQEKGIWHDDMSVEESPFYTSLAINALLLGKAEFSSVIDKGISYLVETQLRDGSWEPKPILRIPRPNILNPNAGIHWEFEDVKGKNSIFKDKNACFTTATVYSCLQDYLQNLGS